MSFSGIRFTSPEVVGTVGLSCFAALPFLKGTFEKKDIPFVAVQGVNLCVYGISFWRVTEPGRKDSKSKKAKSEEVAPQPSPAKPKKKSKVVAPKVRTLMPPDGWGFLIWAPVFVGECLMVGTQLALTETSPLAPVVREVTGPYIFAKAFQILWTNSFQPGYEKGIFKYIAALNLSGLALSLSFCHRAYSKPSARERYTMMDFLLNFLPLSLHFGWTTVTSLVNWNASFAIESRLSIKNLAYLAHASVAAATTAGTMITFKRKAPLYGAVIAWGLTAVASGLTKRLDAAEKEKKRDEEFIAIAERQQLLTVAGAIICAMASLVAAFGKSEQKTR